MANADLSTEFENVLKDIASTQKAIHTRAVTKSPKARQNAGQAASTQFSSTTQHTYAPEKNRGNDALKWIAGGLAIVFFIAIFRNDQDEEVVQTPEPETQPNITYNIPNPVPVTTEGLTEFERQGIIPEHPALPTLSSSDPYPNLGIAYTQDKEFFFAYDGDPHRATERALQYCASVTGSTSRCDVRPPAKPIDHQLCRGMSFSSDLYREGSWITSSDPTRRRTPEEIFHQNIESCGPDRIIRKLEMRCADAIEITCNHNNFHRVYQFDR